MTRSIIDISSFALVLIRIKEISTYVHHYPIIFISTLDIPLSIIAFVGNILIIVALQKVSSLYPPSKHLLGCLASTDLGVGLIHIPYEVESICLEITRRTGTTSDSFLSSRVCCLAAYLY